MESFPPTPRARLRYDSTRLLSFRDGCTQAPDELDCFSTICVAAPVPERFGSRRRFHSTPTTPETDPLELPPGCQNWGTPSEKKQETVCSAAKRLLHNLTPENHEELAQQLVRELVQAGMASKEDHVAFAALIYDAAVMKPGLYAKLCVQLSNVMPEFPHLAGEKAETFRRVLLNRCQEVFESTGHIHGETTNLTKPEQAVEREKKENREKLRTLGNIKLIGELFNERLIAERIVLACLLELLKRVRKGTMVEGNVEALCILFKTAGNRLARSTSFEWVMDKFVARLTVIGESTTLPLRLRLILRKALDNLKAIKREELKRKTTSFGFPRSADWFPELNSLITGRVDNSLDLSQARPWMPGLPGIVPKPAFSLSLPDSLRSTPSLAAKPTTTTPDLTRKSVTLVKEYLQVVDLNEARLCVQELHDPRFHPEFVRLAIATALDMREKECRLLLKLLTHLQSEGVISSLDLKEGVLRVPGGLQDMAVDAPLAPKLWGGLLAELVLSGAVELQLVQEAVRKLDDEEGLQQDVLEAVLAKWRSSEESQAQLDEACRKASVDREALLGVAMARELSDVVMAALGAGGAAAVVPELVWDGKLDVTKDEVNLRSLLQRVQMYSGTP